MSDNVIHDTGFNANEWFVLAMIAVGAIAIVAFPKRFTPLQTTFNLLIGIVFGLLFDHTIAVPPFDFYDVGDESAYQWFDVFSYVMYAPFGYFFVYFMERWRIRGGWLIPYVAAWTAVGIGIEWVSVMVGLFHYKNEYKILYSIPIYAYLQSLHTWLYRLAFSETSRDASSASRKARRRDG
jgi:hypothetical protein